MNAHVHPAFGRMLSGMGGAPAKTDRRDDEIYGLRETIKRQERRIRALVPDVELVINNSRSQDPVHDEAVVVPPEVVEEAVGVLVDENEARLAEICADLRKRDRRYVEGSL